MYKSIITLTLALISFNSQANPFLPRYGEPIEPSFRGNNASIYKQTGQKEKVSIITCKMAGLSLYKDDYELKPKLTFEMHPVGVIKYLNYKIGHVVIKKNGQVVNQFYMPKGFAFNAYPFWGKANNNGLMSLFGGEWAVRYSIYEDAGILLTVNEKTDKLEVKYFLISCNDNRSISVPVYDERNVYDQFDNDPVADKPNVFDQFDQK